MQLGACAGRSHRLTGAAAAFRRRTELDASQPRASILRRRVGESPTAGSARRRRSGFTRLLLIGSAVSAIVLATPAHAEPVSPWDPSLPSVLSAGAPPGDPLAIANASLQASANAAKTTMDMGRKFLSSLGLTSPATDPSSGLSGNRVYGAQAIEYVIRRAGSQRGVPYSWGGGGSLNGPSRGIDSGAGTVGFDCSGLTRYAFAGVGILLPPLLRRSIRRRPKGSPHRKPNGGATSCSGGVPREASTKPLSGRRPDARGPTNRGAGEGLARAHRRDDPPVRNPHH